MPKYHNPALYQEPISQRAKVIPSQHRESLLSWLERTNRFQSSTTDDFQNHNMSDELDDILESEVYPLDNEEE